MSQMWLNFVITLSPNAQGKLESVHLSPSFVNPKTAPQTYGYWPFYRNEIATNIVFRLDGTHLESDTSRHRVTPS